MNTIKTPRGTFNIAANFETAKEVNDSGFYYYFTNDDGTHIYTKHIDMYHVKFATCKEISYV